MTNLLKLLKNDRSVDFIFNSLGKDFHITFLCLIPIHTRQGVIENVNIIDERRSKIVRNRVFD